MSNGGAELLTTSQVAERYRLSVTHLNRLALKGELPYERKLPGRTGAYLFNSSAIEAYLSQRGAA
jgi:excisionase family DNA binding protein